MKLQLALCHVLLTSLQLYLESLGANVISYIPSRTKEGYGMSVAAVSKLAEEGIKLIVTVDTGITANHEIAYAAELGMDTVVTDHHECHAEIPACSAIINPIVPIAAIPSRSWRGSVWCSS